MNPHPPRRRVRPWLIVVLVLVPILLVVALVATWFLTGPSLTWSSGKIPQVTYSGEPGVSGQRLLPSMKEQPTPGWRVDLETLLPKAGKPNVESYVGEHDDRAFFTVGDLGAQGGWLLGVDVTTGATLFEPVALPGPGLGACYLNGPRRVVCAQPVGPEERPPYDLVVVDTERGALLGRSTLELDPTSEDGPPLRPVGEYLVMLQGNAVHGVGDDGALTWSIPSSVGITALDGRAFPGDEPTNVAVANGGLTVRPFSAVDGTVLVETEGKAQPIVGGFVVQLPDRHTFDVYDEKGAKLGRYALPDGVSGELWKPAGQLPAIELNDLTGPSQTVMLDARGTPITVLDANASGRPLVVGDDVFVSVWKRSNAEQLRPWLRFDLRTGEQTASCPGLPVDSGSYVGSDGTVVLGLIPPESDVNGVADRLVSVDPGTCEKLWELDDAAATWTVGATLVQARPDRSELIALVPA